MKICDVLKQRIRESDHKQRSIALKIGLNETTFSAKLNGHRKLYADEFRDICLALSLNADEILRDSVKIEKDRQELKKCGNMLSD